MMKTFAGLFMALGMGLAGCSALMPTRDIPSKDAVGEYPAIGAVPPSTMPALSEDERTKMTKELEAAREKNKRAAGAPDSKQIQ